MPSLNVNMGQTPPRSLAESRGKNWGLPDAPRANVPITRKILLQVDAEHLTLRSDSRQDQHPRVIQLSERTEDNMDELVSGIWTRIESWGTAGAQMYWLPVLSVDVQPGGERRYEDLKALLHDSGIKVERHKPRPARHPARHPARRPTHRYPRTRTPD